jgi:hypothetical protein
LILGALGEVAVEQQIFLIGGGCATRREYGGKHRAQKNCTVQSRAAAWI